MSSATGGANSQDHRPRQSEEEGLDAAAVAPVSRVLQHGRDRLRTRGPGMVSMYSYNIIDDDRGTEVQHYSAIPERLSDQRHLSKSALRALDVLEFFAACQRPARAVEVARSLGLSPSSADQLLKTLVSRAYLIFDFQRKLYHPSPRLLGFASHLDNSYFGAGRLGLLMKELMEMTGFPVSISAPFGRWMRVIDFIEPPGQSYRSSAGHLFPLFSSAAGSAILATWPQSSVRSLLEKSEDQIGAVAAQPEAFLDRLNVVRANGHAFGGLSEASEECSIAVALPRAGFGTELALSVRGPSEALKAKRWRLAARIEEAVTAHLIQTTEPADISSRQ
jgi:DNA-binding IclR family transcriptional regulator